MRRTYEVEQLGPAQEPSPKGETIDKHIYAVVKALNDAGIPTWASCSGLEEDHPYGGDSLGTRVVVGDPDLDDEAGDDLEADVRDVLSELGLHPKVTREGSWNIALDWEGEGRDEAWNFVPSALWRYAGYDGSEAPDA